MKPGSLIIPSLILFFLFIPTILADGIPWPRKPIIYEFSAIQQKDQYALIEIVDKNQAVMHLYLSFISIDADPHNLTVILPFKSVPTTFYGDRIKESVFLQNYRISEIEALAARQSSREVAEKIVKETTAATEGYLKLISGSTLVELGLGRYFAGGLLGAIPAAVREAFPEVIPVAVYEFEGGVINVYQVTSGQVLQDFLKEAYEIELPENVKESIDKYQSYYIGVLSVDIEPPISKEILNNLEKTCPRTLVEMKDYVKTHPFIRIEVPGWYRGLPARKAGRPFYDPIKEEIRSRFSDFIRKCKEERKLEPSADVYVGTTPLGHGHRTYTHTFSLTDTYRYVKVILDKCYNDYSKIEVTTQTETLTDECGNNIPPGDTKCCCYIKEHILDLGKVVSGPTQLKLWYRPDLSRSCLDAAKVYVSLKPTPVTKPTIYSVEKLVIEFFYGVYVQKDTDRGVELSMSFILPENEIFYPLGTGVAWTQPIENIKVIVKSPKNLEAAIKGVESIGVDDKWRYYVWTYENENPAIDVVGKIKDATPITKASDSIKFAIQTLYYNTAWLDAILIILLFSLAGFLTWIKMSGLRIADVVAFLQKKKRVKVRYPIYPILAVALLSPLTTIWVIPILFTFLREKPSKQILKESIKVTILFSVFLVIIYAVLKLISWLI